MTTLSASIELKTGSAKQSLQALKKFMQEEMKGVVLSINDQALTNSVQKALKDKKFTVAFDAAALRSQVDKALKEPFAITFNVQGLAAQVAAAVKVGTAGAQVSGGALAAGAGVMSGSALKLMLQETLTPALAELAKAAALVGGTARQIGAGKVSGTSSASVSRSSTDPETGARTTHRQQLANPDSVLNGVVIPGIASAKERKALERAEREDEKFRQTRRRTLEKGSEKDALDSEKGMRANDFAQRREAEKKAIQNENGARASDFAQHREAGKKAAQNEQGMRASDFAQHREAENKVIQNEQGTRASQRARRKADAETEALAVARFHADSLREARKTLTPASAARSAAQATASQYGPERAAKHLGPNAGLLHDFDAYDRKTKQAALSTSALRHSMNDAHGAARGLAGSMGALWTTYGSVVPLVAAAALGGALRSVVMVGKEVEYQLTFVQALTGGTAVSVKQFGDAVRGSMTTPAQAAEGLRALAQNGLSVQEALGALPTVLNLATAGEMSMKEAALGATGVLAAFGLQINEITRVSDVFAKAAAVSNTSVSGMVESMKVASTVGSMYNITLEETAASLAMLAQRNIVGTAAGTSYKNMWAELSTPTEKAKKALASIGAELYDSNKQMKSATEITDILTKKLSVLSDKSRLDVMHAIFNERSIKSADVLFSNAEGYARKLDEVTNQAKGFTQFIATELNKATDGKLMSLFTEFQLQSVAAFNAAGDSVKNFVDALRIGVSSKEFADAVKYLTETVVNLSKYLIEHGKTVLITIAIWKAGGWLVAAAEGVMALSVAYKAAGTAALAFGVVAKGAIAAATGGLSLLAILAIEYFTMREATDAATESQKAYNNALVVEQDRLNRSNEASTGRIKLLQATIAYQRQGLSLVDARAQAEKDAAGEGAKNLDAQLAARVATQARLMARQDELRVKIRPGQALNTPKQLEEHGDAFPEWKKNNSALERVDADIKKLQEVRNAAAQEGYTVSSEALQAFHASRLEKIREHNGKIDTALGVNAKLKIAQFRIDPAVAPETEREFKEYLKNLQGALSKNMITLPTDDPKAAAAAAKAAARAAALAKSQQRGLVDELRREEDVLKQGARIRREIDQAKYDTQEYGPYLTALLTEQRARADLVTSIELEENALSRLNAEKAKTKDPVVQENLDNEIDRRKHALAAFRRDQAGKVEVDKLNAASRDRDARAEAQAMLTGLSVKTDEQIAKGEQKYLLKIIDPVDAARAQAVLQVVHDYAEKIALAEDNITRAVRARTTLEKMKEDATKDTYDVAVANLAVANAHLDSETKILQTLREQSLVDQGRAGKSAGDNEANSRTASFGMDKFWKDYRESGESNAKAVEDIMQSTTDSMSDMVANFAITGKLNFRSFARDVAAQAAKMMANRAVMQLLGMAANMMFGGGGGAAGAPIGGFNGSAGTSFIPTNMAAKGDVMTDFGPMALEKFQAGGIARRPMVSMFGEGRKPEAYVPLEDGRTIPVTVQGGSGGGSTNVSTNVYLSSDGGSKVESDGTGQKAAALGKMIEQATLEILVREKRPGGILSMA